MLDYDAEARASISPQGRKGTKSNPRFPRESNAAKSTNRFAGTTLSTTRNMARPTLHPHPFPRQRPLHPRRPKNSKNPKKHPPPPTHSINLQNWPKSSLFHPFAPDFFSNIDTLERASRKKRGSRGGAGVALPIYRSPPLQISLCVTEACSSREKERDFPGEKPGCELVRIPLGLRGSRRFPRACEYFRANGR